MADEKQIRVATPAGGNKGIEGAEERKGIVVMPVATAPLIDMPTVAPAGPPAPQQSAPAAPPPPPTSEP